MYLSELSVAERKNFLELAYCTMGLNGTYKEQEKAIFESFTHECGMPSYQLKKQDDIDGVIKLLTRSEVKNRRIILVELFGIVLADNEFCESETEFMLKLAAAFDIAEFELKRLQRWVEAMNDLVHEGFSLIMKD
ncbi:hypothetical protein GCM10009347_32610 [Shewanella algicola]|uniref:TerB family tellurite resistance protein n=1 Tax=Shewanella algicola TaxID=640633 RepID=A0A9X1ZA92_9GAMM|nr:TerB family tellurite resistance protein [Shewanella algicola]MCL1107009.1 TerB family tellurite resistance protein [Shewanella algicola]GGP64142.1 hypothetical protein GCM10009347_32610 [Shewanella algicola]